MEATRARYLAAIALVWGGGCRERERWPEERERPRPIVPGQGEGLDCEHGVFCEASPAEARAAAPAPWADCEIMRAVPATAASAIPADKRGMLRVRFDGEATARARGRGERSCCYFWFEHC